MSQQYKGVRIQYILGGIVVNNSGELTAFSVQALGAETQQKTLPPGKDGEQ